MSLFILFHFLRAQRVSDINISIIRSLRLFLLNYHIVHIVLGSMCIGVSVWSGWSGIRVADFQTDHTETPTHIEPRTVRPMW
jgi:hypothetical protein